MSLDDDPDFKKHVEIILAFYKSHREQGRRTPSHMIKKKGTPRGFGGISDEKMEFMLCLFEGEPEDLYAVRNFLDQRKMPKSGKDPD